MYGPKRQFLLRYGSRDTRRIDFSRVDGLSTDPPVLGRHMLYNSLRQFFGKSFIEIPFTTIFLFLSCHALTLIVLSYLGAYEMHYAIFIQHMPMYQSCLY